MVPRAILVSTVCVTALVLALVSVKRAPADTETKAKPSVKLVVFVAFDQMRGDYLDKWSSTFGKDGFERMKSQGVWYPDCHYPYAATATGPGHAAMLKAGLRDPAQWLGGLMRSDAFALPERHLGLDAGSADVAADF